MRAQELQVANIEKQQILEFESQLAAASSKQLITEQSSLLLSTIIGLNPHGPLRRPPQPVLDQLKQLNTHYKIGHLLCRSRKPDFLLDILQRQGTNQAMPWLADLVENSEGSFSVLPVQCLCEFLLNDALAVNEGEESEQVRDVGKERTSLNCPLLGPESSEEEEGWRAAGPSPAAAAESDLRGRDLSRDPGLLPGEAGLGE